MDPAIVTSSPTDVGGMFTPSIEGGAFSEEDIARLNAALEAGDVEFVQIMDEDEDEEEIVLN
jgi:hypothetical protein